MTGVAATLRRGRPVVRVAEAGYRAVRELLEREDRAAPASVLKALDLHPHDRAVVLDELLIHGLVSVSPIDDGDPRLTSPSGRSLRVRFDAMPGVGRDLAQEQLVTLTARAADVRVVARPSGA